MKILFLYFIFFLFPGEKGTLSLEEKLQRIARGGRDSAAVFVELNRQGDRILNELLRALVSSDPDISSGAALLLSRSPSSQSASALLEYLQKGNPSLHPGSMLAISHRIGIQARPYILPYLRNKNPSSRTAALQSILPWGTLEDFLPVASLLEDKDSLVQKTAMICLGCLWERNLSTSPHKLQILFHSLSLQKKKILSQNPKFLPKKIQKSLEQFLRTEKNISLLAMPIFKPSPAFVSRRTESSSEWKGRIFLFILIIAGAILLYYFFELHVVYLPLPFEKVLGKPENTLEKNPTKNCSQKNCTRRHFQEGFCALHYVEHKQALRESTENKKNPEE